jgi:pimeloyl-ACP methyl ester carboxylesterase
MSVQAQTQFVRAGGHQLECVLYPAHQVNRPTLVFLHEGLGSVAMWRDFPSRVAQASGCRTLVYSRHGYGQSDLPEASFSPDYMHHEAWQTLPELLAALQIENPLLIGHSDGGSIALMYAGSVGAEKGVAGVAGIITMAPHCFVEDVSISSIEAAKTAARETDLLKKLGRYHRDATKTFWRWNDIWLHPDFRDWNIEAMLPAIRCPILAIQGEDDEYGTLAQIDAIRTQAVNSPLVDILKLADCRHSAHKDQPEAVIRAIVDFIEAG